MLVIVALVAIGACVGTFKFFQPLRANGAASHKEIHNRLNLTATQDKALEAREEEFEKQQRELLDQIRSANQELAQAIKEDQAYSSRLGGAVDKIRHAQAELQRVTLEHVFGMKDVLTPAQYKKLLDLTAEELNQINRGP